MADPVRVLIVDDHTIVRSGVRLLLESEEDITVVGEAISGEESLNLIESLQPDVVLMDITMPGIDGMEATRQIKERWPETQILALTMHKGEEYFYKMIKLGASGYILKTAEADELIHAVRIVASGEIYLYPTMTRQLVKDYFNLAAEDKQDKPALSPRESEILRLLADGYSSKEIADKLVISVSTFYTHRYNLMNKLGLSNQRELFQYAREHGFLGNS